MIDHGNSETSTCIQVYDNDNPSTSVSLPGRLWNGASDVQTRLTRGLAWSIYSVTLATWGWPDEVYGRACGVKNRTANQDLGIQIFFWTTFGMAILVPGIKKISEKIAKYNESNRSVEKYSEIIETSLLEAAGICVYIGANPLLQPIGGYSFIPAVILAATPLGHLLYKLRNPSYYRGSWQDYSEQFDAPYSHLLTASEALVKAAMMGSLALKLTESIINTIIDAMLTTNLSSTTVNITLFIAMLIVGIIGGILSMLHPKAWMGVSAAAITVNALFPVFEFPVSYFACWFPQQLENPAGYRNGGWAWVFLSGMIALAYALPTAVKGYQNPYKTIANFNEEEVSEESEHEELDVVESPTTDNTCSDWISNKISSISSCTDCSSTIFNSKKQEVNEKSVLVINSTTLGASK